MDKIDIFEWVRAYIGFGVLTWLGLWSMNHGYAFGSHITGFISSLGGILK